jgi:hypothetical protein
MDGLHLQRTATGCRVYRGEKLVGSIMVTRRGRATWVWHDVNLWEFTASQLFTVIPAGWEFA